MKALLVALSATGIFFSITPAQAPTEWCWATKTWLEKEMPRRVWAPDTRKAWVAYYFASSVWRQWGPSLEDCYQRKYPG
jgi:hypothetical protein